MPSYITTYTSLLFYYFLFFIVVSMGAKKGSGQLENILSGKGKLNILFSRLLAGIFFLGIGSVVIFEKRNIDASIISIDWDEDFTFVWLLIIIAAFIGLLSASNKSYPHYNSKHHLPFFLSISFLFIRTLFLIVYEFFFRGVLLFVMIEDLGIIIAIFINLILYTLVHWFDKKERYGSIIMGSILCGVTIYYHSIWPAIFIHLSLALSHEIVLLVNNRSLIKKSWL